MGIKGYDRRAERKASRKEIAEAAAAQAPFEPEEHREAAQAEEEE